jgi:hypothetical protein
VVRIDGHSQVTRTYLQQLHEAFHDIEREDPMVGCVGGSMDPINRSTRVAEAIGLAQSSPVGTGRAAYRLGVPEPTRVETVAFGISRTQVLRDLGGFDARFLRNQDDELNLRLRRSGRHIYCVPGVHIGYVGRSSLRALARQYYQYGLFKPAVYVENRTAPAARHVVPLSLVIALASTLAVAVGRRRMVFTAPAFGYVACCLALGQRRRRGTGGVLVALATMTMHLAYGVGTAHGVLRYVTGRGMPRL